MQHRMRARGTVAALSLAAALTGCGAHQAQTTRIDLVPATASPSPAASSTAVDSATCFDVADAYSGLQLLPLSDQNGGGTREDEETDERSDDAVAQARESLTRVREQLPDAVRPAFDDVLTVLDDAGDTLEPREAVSLHRALEPAESWLRVNCASTATG